MQQSFLITLNMEIWHAYFRFPTDPTGFLWGLLGSYYYYSIFLLVYFILCALNCS